MIVPMISVPFKPPLYNVYLHKKNEFLRLTVYQIKPWKILTATKKDKEGDAHPFTFRKEEIIVQVLFLVTPRIVCNIK